MRTLPARLLSTVLLTLCAMPALAQEREHKHLSDLMRFPYLGMWLAAALVCYVVFVVGVTVAFQNGNYPPVVARLAWWLGATCFTLFVVFYVIGHMLSIVLPLYALAIIFMLLLLIAVVLAVTRPRAVA